MVKSLKMKTIPSRRTSKRVYDSWESVYRRHKPEDLPWYSPFVHPVLKAVLGRIPVTGGKALDIGCGLGQVARHLACLGWSVTAVDISASAIIQAKQLTKPGSTITYRRANSLTLALSTRFDLVVDYLHLHDIQPPDVDHYLSALKQIAANWIVMGYLCSEEQQSIVRPSLYFDGVVTQYTRSGISASMKALGFQEVAFDPCALQSHSVEYQCEIVTFRRSIGIRLGTEVRE